MFSPLFSNICPLKVIEHILSFHYMYYECAHIHVHVKDLGSLDIHIILLVDYLLNHNLDVKIGYRQSLVCINMPICFSLWMVQMAEYRISIYGRKQSEWDQLASWFVNNELYGEFVWPLRPSQVYELIST